MWLTRFRGVTRSVDNVRPVFQRRRIWFQSEQTNWRLREAQKIDWRNPKDRLDHIPDHVVFALPPQEPPAIYSTKEKRKRQLRSRLPGIVASLVILLSLLYKALNSKRKVRVWMNTYAPHVEQLLERVGVFEGFPQAKGLSRPALFRRIWLQFADSDQGVLASEAVDIADLLTQQIGWSNSDTTRKVLWDTIRQVTERQDNVSDTQLRQVRLDGPTFVAFLELVLDNTNETDTVLYLNSMDSLGICPVTPEAEASLCALYDFCVKQQKSANFTVDNLSELSQNVGVGLQDEAARQFLTDSRAVQLNEVDLNEDDFLMIRDGVVLDKPALQKRQNENVSSEQTQWLLKSNVAIPLRRHEWVNFWAYVMRHCSAEQVQHYVDVYIMLQSMKKT